MTGQIIRIGLAYCWAVYDGHRLVRNGISLSRAAALAAMNGDTHD